MFVYIFCIIWAAFFAFLAEREFKKSPVKTKASRENNKLLNRERKKKSIPEGQFSQQLPTAMSKVDTENSDMNKHTEIILDGNDQIVVMASPGTDSSLSEHLSQNREIAEMDESIFSEEPAQNEGITIKMPDITEDVQSRKFDGGDDADNVTTDTEQGIDYVGPVMRRARRTIITNNLPLNRGPASRISNSVKGQGIKVAFLDDNDGTTEETKEERFAEKQSSKKSRIRVVDDILVSKKRAIEKRLVENAKTDDNKKVEPKRKIERGQHVVGNEIFRGKESRYAVERKKKIITVSRNMKTINKDDKDE